MTIISKTKDVCLVQMPVALATVPSLSLSLFKALLNRQNISSIVIYGNLRFLEKINPEHSNFIDRSPNNHLIGEFLFTEAVGWETAKDTGEYPERLADTFNYRYSEIMPKYASFWQQLPEMRRTANEVVAEAVEEVLSLRPKIVACSSMFQQNLASLALLRQIKAREPGIITLIGGANCMGEAAVAMAESMPWLDYVFSGEADEIIAGFCAELLASGPDIPRGHLPYGVVKKGMFLQEEAPYRVSGNLDKLPPPDYSDYFEALERSSLKGSIDPALLIEGSRGCWWGEKKPCSFCGLGGVSHQYRQKSTDKVFSEIKELAAKHGINKFAFTDSILSMKHVEELTPKLKELNASRKNKYVFFSEIKSNLTEKQVKNLRDAGFSWIQPGIESIQDDLLKAMNKGNRAIKHIEFLKHCRTYCLFPVWNMLIGIPLEKNEWLDQTADLIPLITHLAPPMHHTRRIAYQKYSVYVNNPREYGLCLRPVEAYSYLYPDKGAYEGLIEKIAYLFEPVDKTARDEYYEVAPLAQYAGISSQVEAWNKKFHNNGDTMTMQVYSDKIEIMDLRAVSKKKLVTLTGVEKEIYSAAESIISKAGLFSKLESRFGLNQIEQAIAKLCQDKLMLEINGELLALASKKLNYRYHPSYDAPMGNRKTAKNTTEALQR